MFELENKIVALIKENVDEQKAAREVDELLKNGANVHFTIYQNGKSFLHLCVEQNKTKIANVLIAHKINLEHREISGKTALYLAAEQLNPLMTKILIDAGATVDIL